MTISKLRAANLKADNAGERFLELVSLAKNLGHGEFGLCSELVLSGYDKTEFTEKLQDKICSNLKQDSFLGFSFLNDENYNEFAIFSSDGKIYLQKKSKLFSPNKEQEIFRAANVDQTRIFTIDGIKFGVLICFELRFIELWQKLSGAQVILVPALWGARHGEHFITLCGALAMQNRCYVVACSDLDFKFSCVFAPDGTNLGHSTKFERTKISEFTKSLGL